MNDQLFFKVIKNKYLFKKIIGYINDDDNDYSHISLLIKYNKIKKIIELVNNKKPIIFSYHNNKPEEKFAKTIQKLFILINIKNKDKQIYESYHQTIDDTIEYIKSFYESLFQQYQLYFDFRILADIAIKSDNLLVLELLLNKEYIKLNQLLVNNLILTSIKTSLTILKYLINYVTNNNNNNNQSISIQKYTITEISNLIIEDYYCIFKNKKFKILNYLLENDQIIKERKNHKIKIEIPKHLFDDDPFYNNFTIQNTIDACRLYYNIYYRPHILNNYLNQINKNLELISNNNQTFSSKQQLKTKLKKAIHTTTTTDGHEYLKLLLSTYQIIIKKPMLINYLKYEMLPFDDDHYDKDEQERFKRILKNNLPNKLNTGPIYQENVYIKQSLKYGNLDFCLDRDLLVDRGLIFTLYTEKENMNLLFKHVKDKKKHQISFIDQVLKPDGRYNHIMDKFLLICLLVHFNDISLLEYIFNNKFFENEPHIGIGDKMKLVYSIKSVEMLNYCWSNEYLKEFFNKTSIATCFEYGRIDLIERYQKLICDKQNIWELLSYSEFKHLNKGNCLNGKVLKTLCYMISNTKAFNLSNVDIFTCIQKAYDKHLYLEEIKFIIQNTPQSLKYYPYIFQEPFRNRLIKKGSEYDIKVFTNTFKYNNFVFYKITNWIFKNRLNDDIHNKRYDLQYYDGVEYFAKFQELLSKTLILDVDLKKVSIEIARTNNLNGLLKIIELYFKFEHIQTTKYLNCFKHILVACSEYGNLNLIKYIVNYPKNLFQKIIESPSLFNQPLITSIITTSLAYGNFNILDYFLNYLNLNQVRTVVNNLSNCVPIGLNFENLINKINIILG